MRATEEIVLPPSPNWYNSHATSVSCDGKFIAYAAGNTVVLFQPTHRKVQGILLGHSKRVSAVCFGLDGCLVTSSQDRSLRLWSVPSGECIRTVHKRPAECTALVTLARIPEVAVAGDVGGSLTLWPFETGGKPELLQTKCGSSVMTIAACPEGKPQVAVGCEDGTVVLVDVDADIWLRCLDRSHGPVQSLHWSKGPHPKHSPFHARCAKDSRRSSGTGGLRPIVSGSASGAKPGGLDSQEPCTSSSVKEVDVGTEAMQEAGGNLCSPKEGSSGDVEKLSAEEHLNCAMTDTRGHGYGAKVPAGASGDQSGTGDAGPADDVASGAHGELKAALAFPHVTLVFSIEGTSQRVGCRLLVGTAVSDAEGKVTGRCSVLVAGCQDHRVRVWYLPPHSDLQAPNPHLKGTVLDVPVPGGRLSDSQRRHPFVIARVCPVGSGVGSDVIWIVAGGMGGRLYAWRLLLADGPRPSKPLSLPAVHHRTVFTLDFILAPGARELAMVTSGLDRLLAVWGPAKPSVSIMDTTWRNFRVRWSCVGLGGDVMAIDVSSCGALALAAGCGDKTIRLLPLQPQDQRQGDATVRWNNIPDKVVAVCWHPSRPGTLAFGCEDGHIGLLRSPRDMDFVFPDRHKGPVTQLSWRCVPGSPEGHPDSVLHNESVELYSLGREGCLLKWPAVDQEHFSSAGEARRGSQGSARSAVPFKQTPTDIMLHLAEGTLGPAACCSAFDWDSSGMQLAVGFTDGRVSIYTAPTQIGPRVHFDLIHACQHNSQPVHTVCWSQLALRQCDTLLAVRHEDGTAMAICFPAHHWSNGRVEQDRTVTSNGGDWRTAGIAVCRLEGHKMSHVVWSTSSPNVLHCLTQKGQMQMWRVSGDGASMLVACVLCGHETSHWGCQHISSPAGAPDQVMIHKGSRWISRWRMHAAVGSASDAQPHLESVSALCGPEVAPLPVIPQVPAATSFVSQVKRNGGKAGAAGEVAEQQASAESGSLLENSKKGLDADPSVSMDPHKRHVPAQCMRPCAEQASEEGAVSQNVNLAGADPLCPGDSAVGKDGGEASRCADGKAGVAPTLVHACLGEATGQRASHKKAPGKHAGSKRRKSSSLGTKPLIASDKLLEHGHREQLLASCVDLVGQVQQPQIAPSGCGVDAANDLQAALGTPLPLGMSSGLWQHAEVSGTLEEPIDSKTAEHQAALCIWRGDIAGAMDVLADGDALSGDFLSMSVAGGRALWEASVRSHAKRLEASGEPHMCALHLLSINDVRGAIETYRRAGMIDDAVNLGSLRLLPQDPLLRELHEVHAEQQAKRGSHALAAASWLMAGQPIKAVRVIGRSGGADGWASAARVAVQCRGAGVHGIEECWDAVVRGVLESLGCLHVDVATEILEGWGGGRMVGLSFLSGVVEWLKDRWKDAGSEIQTMIEELASVVSIEAAVQPIWSLCQSGSVDSPQGVSDAKCAAEDLHDIDPQIVDENKGLVAMAHHMCLCFLHHVAGDVDKASEMAEGIAHIQIDPWPTQAPPSPPQRVHVDVPGMGDPAGEHSPSAAGVGDRDDSEMRPGEAARISEDGVRRFRYTKAELLALETSQEYDAANFDASVVPELLTGPIRLS